MTTNRRAFLAAGGAALFMALAARKGFGNRATECKIELLLDGVNWRDPAGTA